MSFFGFGQSAEIDIVLNGIEDRETAEIKTEDGKREKHYLFYDGETVSGVVNVTLKKSGSKLEHQGIKIEFIGQIELYYDRGNHHEFTSLVKELARPGELTQNTSYPFEFLNVEKPFESYTGSNVRLRYFLRVTVVRRLSDIVKELELVVHTLSSYPEANNALKMEVGIEDCLHIEFEYNKAKYHLKDVIVGKIYFLLVRIKIKHMEIAIIKKETTGSSPHIFTENDTIARYEIMDGAPVKGESIPIRVFLAGYELTPTMRDINKKFSTRYYLNLVLMDEEDRRYFKQQACDLMLKLCSSIMKKELKCVKREGATFLYVKQLSDIFYRTLLNIIKEFRKVFPSSSACSAALIVWSNHQLTQFMSHVIKQVFVPQSSITVISECVSHLRSQNSQLCDYGLDMRYQMEGMLHRSITITLQDAKDKITESIKHRSAEEKWRPMNLQNKNNLNKLIQELSDLGLSMVHSYVKGECWLELTPNTVAFTKLFMLFLEDCLKVYSQDLHFIIEDVLYEPFHTQLRMLQNALRSHTQDSEVQLIDRNLRFVIDHLLNVIEHNFEGKSGVPSAKLASLSSEFNHLKRNMTKPKPAPRSISKYRTEEFI